MLKRLHIRLNEQGLINLDTWTIDSTAVRAIWDRSGRLGQEVLRYRNAAQEELPPLDKCCQYDASDNLILDRLTQQIRIRMRKTRFLTGPHLPTDNLMIDASWQVLHAFVPLFSRP